MIIDKPDASCSTVSITSSSWYATDGKSLPGICYSLAIQPYFPSFPLEVQEGENNTSEDSGQLSTEQSLIKYEVQIQSVRSKLSTWLPGYQPVYYSLTMAFYDTDVALGFILHMHMTGTSWVQEQHQDKVTCSCILKLPVSQEIWSGPMRMRGIGSAPGSILSADAILCCENNLSSGVVQVYGQEKSLAVWRMYKFIILMGFNHQCFRNQIWFHTSRGHSNLLCPCPLGDFSSIGENLIAQVVHLVLTN